MTAALLVDAGWGDWRVADSPETRVTQAQADVVLALSDVEGVDAADVRFDDRPAELVVFHTDGRATATVIAEDGSTEDVPL